MNRNNIKIWLLFQLLRHHQFLPRNSLQLLTHIKDLTRLVQQATTLKCQQSSLKHQSTISQRAKSSENYLNITNKLTTIKHGTKTQGQESTTIKSWDRNNSILLVKTLLSNLKCPTARTPKTRVELQGQVLIKLWSQSRRRQMSTKE